MAMHFKREKNKTNLQSSEDICSCLAGKLAFEDRRHHTALFSSQILCTLHFLAPTSVNKISLCGSNGETPSVPKQLQRHQRLLANSNVDSSFSCDFISFLPSHLNKVILNEVYDDALNKHAGRCRRESPYKYAVGELGHLERLQR